MWHQVGATARQACMCRFETASAIWTDCLQLAAVPSVPLPQYLTFFSIHRTRLDWRVTDTKSRRPERHTASSKTWRGGTS